MCTMMLWCTMVDPAKRVRSTTGGLMSCLLICLLYHASFMTSSCSACELGKRGTRGPRPLATALLWLHYLLARQCAAASDNKPPSWTTVGARRVVLESVDGAGLFALARNTLIGGDIIVHGATNLQHNFTACAQSCVATPNCVGVNYCQKGQCPVDLQGEKVSEGACQLVHQQTAEDGRGVVELAEGSPELGDAAVRVLVAPPDPSAHPGFRLFMAQSLLYVYDYPCADSVVPDGCVIEGELPDLLVRCNADPRCEALVISDTWGNYTIPYGILKGSGNASLDPSQGNLNPVAYTLVRESALPGAAAQTSGGGGLSAGAIAGIAMAAGVVALAVVAATLVLLRGRRRWGADPEKSCPHSADKWSGMGAAAAGGGSRGSALGSPSSELSAIMEETLSEGSSATAHRQIVQLLSETPGPQWADAIVQRQRIQICTRDGRPVKLGGGSCGTVYKAVLDGATPCAVKCIDFGEDASLPKYFVQEATVLRSFMHPNITLFLGISLAEGRGMLLTELLAGDLWKALRADSARKGGRTLDWYHRGQKVVLQVASGLQALHKKHILHMDLKSSNVLLAKDGTAKLADVGFSRMMTKKSHVSSLDGRIGTFVWCAPEVLLGGRASHKSDIFGLGVILWEVCTGEEPQRGCMEPLQVPLHCSPEIAALQARCVRANPEGRPSIEEIIQVLRAAGGARPVPPSEPPTAAATAASGSTPDSGNLAPAAFCAEVEAQPSSGCTAHGHLGGDAAGAEAGEGEGACEGVLRAPAVSATGAGSGLQRRACLSPSQPHVSPFAAAAAAGGAQLSPFAGAAGARLHLSTPPSGAEVVATAATAKQEVPESPRCVCLVPVRPSISTSRTPSLPDEVEGIIQEGGSTSRKRVRAW